MVYMGGIVIILLMMAGAFAYVDSAAAGRVENANLRHSQQRTSETLETTQGILAETQAQAATDDADADAKIASLTARLIEAERARDEAEKDTGICEPGCTWQLPD